MQTQTIAPAQKRVDVIPANVLINRPNSRKKKLRVAAYCRVSTELEEQQSSYAAQIDYYTEKIKQNKEWEFAGIFADEGITGTSTKKRTEFLKLMALCEKGKIDMVLTKSVSRFSRNKLDAITYIRKLKAKGIPIVFEREGINTMQMASEMVLCFLSGFAQAESESISRNVTWGITEAQALQLCYDRGFDFGGLYEIYHHPELWAHLRDMDIRAIAQFGVGPLGQFKKNWSVERLEQRFALEDKTND